MTRKPRCGWYGSAGNTPVDRSVARTAPVLRIGLLVACLVGVVDAGDIKLTWKDRSRIEESYHIERSIAGGIGFQELEVPEGLGPNTETYSYDDPTQGGQLRFRVYAENQYGASGYSNTSSTLPPQILVEDTPFELMVFTDGHPTTEWGSFEPHSEGAWQSSISLAVSHQQGSGGVPGQAVFDDIRVLNGAGGIIVSEDFDVGTSGEYPVNWEINPDWPWSKPFNELVSDPATGEGLGFSLVGAGANVTGSYLPGSYSPDAVAVEFDLFLPLENGTGGNPAYFVYGGASAIAYVNEDRSVSVRLGHDALNALDGLSLDRRYRIRMELDMEKSLVRLVLISAVTLIEGVDIRAELAADGASLIGSFLVAPSDSPDVLQISITPRPDYYGATMVSLDLVKGTERLVKVFRLEISPENDLPYFVGGPAELTQLQGDEELVFFVSVDDPDLDHGDSFASLSLEVSTADEGLLLGNEVNPDADLKRFSVSLQLNPNWYGNSVLNLRLSDGIGDQVSREIPIFVQAVPRVFAGSFGEDGRFALFVDESGTARFVAVESNPGELIVREGLVVTPAGVIVDESAGVETVTGLMDSRLVNGELLPEAIAFSGSWSFGSERFERAYQICKPVPLLPGGVVKAIVGQDGLVFLTIESPMGAWGVVSDLENEFELNGSWGEGLVFAFHLDPASDLMTGSAEFAGLHWPVASAVDPDARESSLVNLSTRSWAGSGTDSIIAGFVLEGEEIKGLLIRGIGPGLADFGVALPLEDPFLTLNKGPNVLALNEDWGGGDAPDRLAEITQELGGFELRPGSLDSGLYAELGAGLFTAVVAGKQGESGEALVELYDASTSNVSKLINLSTRLKLTEGGSSILGFVVSGDTRIRVLIRAIGPGLEEFGVDGVLPDPALSLFRAPDFDTPFLENDDWSEGNSEDLSEISGQVGAFPLPAGSADSGIVVWLDSGVYTVTVADSNGEPGVVLTELYLVD